MRCNTFAWHTIYESLNHQKMKQSKYGLLLFLLAIFGATACSEGTETDFTYDWMDFGLLEGEATATSIVAFSNRILTGTNDGVQVFEQSNAAQGWRKSGLDGIKINKLILQPGTVNTLYALTEPAESASADTVYSIYKSTNGGNSWIPVSKGLLDRESGTYPPARSLVEKVIEINFSQFYDLIFYMNLGGDAVARSIDYGENWQIVQGSVAPSYDDKRCDLALAQMFLTYMYQACTSGNDQSEIVRIDLNVDDEPQLRDGVSVVKASDIGNRQLTGIVTSLYSPGFMYAYVEGGLLAIVENDWKWVYQYTGGQQGLNTTMTFMWTSPMSQNHLVFGGYQDGNSTGFGVYETENHGGHNRLVEPPSFLGLNAPRVVGGVAAGSSAQDLLLAVSGTDMQNRPRSRVVAWVRQLPD